MQNKVIITKEGLAKIKSELEVLINEERPKIVERVAQAKDYGDSTENIEYDEAKNEQMITDKRISELRNVIKRADIPEFPKAGEAGIGSTVVINYAGEDHEYILVGNYESDPKNGKISHSSPIGESLMGCKVGEEIEIDIPAGKQSCKVKSIK